MLLQQMGLSEDEQLELALELSMQGIYTVWMERSALHNTIISDAFTHYNSPLYTASINQYSYLL